MASINNPADFRSRMIEVRSIVANFDDFHKVWIKNADKVKLTKQVGFAKTDLIIHISTHGMAGNGWYLSFDGLRQAHYNLVKCCKELNLPERTSIQMGTLERITDYVAKSNTIEYMITKDAAILFRYFDPGTQKMTAWSLTELLHIMKSNLDDVTW